MSERICLTPQGEDSVLQDRNRYADNTLGLYLHIPFCKSKCRYCDFCSFPNQNRDVMEAYTDRLCQELALAAERCRDRRIDTVYFGGGTPTCLPISLFVRILETVWRYYRVEESAEITSECNPATGNGEYFSCLRQSGVNRLSIGLQSADDGELRALGRIHTFSQFQRTYSQIRNAGFGNVSVDLMFGLPGQTRTSFLKTLRRVTALYPEHLSVYGLILEEGTPFYEARDKLSLPSEDTECAMYEDAVKFLAERGFARYEISNFSKQGRQSRHNLRYWDCREYLGFGVAAHSYLEGKRFSHSRDLQAYLAGQDITEFCETVSLADAEDEYVMLRLRLDEGIEGAVYETRFGEPFVSHYGKRLLPYVREGFVKREGGRWFFTAKGTYVSNQILADILDLKEI